MTYLELCSFLELFTIRNHCKYDKDLLKRCRMFILSTSYRQYRKYSYDSNQIPFHAVLDNLKCRSLLLNNDDYRFISSFCDYICMLTNFV